jgi:hypothetical protein
MSVSQHCAQLAFTLTCLVAVFQTACLYPRTSGGRRSYTAWPYPCILCHSMPLPSHSCTATICTAHLCPRMCAHHHLPPSHMSVLQHLTQHAYKSVSQQLAQHGRPLLVGVPAFTTTCLYSCKTVHIITHSLAMSVLHHFLATCPHLHICVLTPSIACPYPCIGQLATFNTASPRTSISQHLAA